MFRNIKLHSLALVALLSAFVLSTLSCSKEANLRESLPGEWHYSDAASDVYIAFSADGHYELFQKIGEGRYREYRGEWTLKKNILSGNYGEGIAWGSSYRVEIDGDNLLLSATNGSGEKTVYRRESVPASVRESAETAV
ncbi:MAG: lipocalin family protein [Candidatus Cryptobacteroides sp.]